MTRHSRRLTHERWRRTVIVRALTMACATVWTVSGGNVIAQGVVLPTAQAPTAARVTGSADEAFQRTIAVRFDDVTLKEALRGLGQRAGLSISYSAYAIPVARHVSLVAEKISVRDALSVLLEDTGMEPIALAPGRIALQPIGERAPSTNAAREQQGGGTIGGRVVDGVTRAPLDQVAVRVEGSGFGVVTASDGRYAVRNVPAGTYRVTVRRVGYTPLTKIVTVADDSVTTADFALAAAPTRLNEMVTTAVGDQRRYEVGNVISTINADSIAPTAPITSLTDLISARAPGVEVLETSGMTGSGEAIRIRGVSSLVLQNDPILIVDGVRQDNSAGGDVGAYFSAGYGGSNGAHPSPSRLNDIDFNDIRSIDVLKGPAASTEYGTDAANGVIVITTKHGQAGRPQWMLSAERTESGIPETFPDGYYSWGHLTGTVTPVDCRLVPAFGSPASTNGTCVVDSITRWNPLNHAATSIFGRGNRGKYDLSVSGGSEVVQYFVAGGLSNETGVIRMPPVFKELADTASLGLPSAAFSPNGEQQRSVRVNTAIRLGSTADLTATGSYFSTYQQTPDAEQLYHKIFITPALSDPANYYGYGGFGAFGTPIGELTAIGSQNTNRVMGGLTARWQPTSWLVAHTTAGLDHGSQRNSMLDYPLSNAAYAEFSPFLGLADVTTDVYSVDLRSTATVSLVRGIRSVTSGGVQLVDTRTAGQTASTIGVTATNLTLNGATGSTVAQLADRQATLGGYAEEELSLADRLFLTGALRIDAGSGFGRAYSTAAYPKASGSWVALNQGPMTMRLRGAFGESGVQPMNGAAATLYAPSVAYLGGTTVTTYPLNWPGNANLRPERSVEFEGGVDLGGWGNRVTLELTAYSKTTHDALVNVSLNGSLCCSTYQENIGKVRNTGVEASATAGLVQGRSVTWDMTVNASVNHNKLISLAPGVADQIVSSYPAQYRQAPGYPLYGLWAPGVTYADANHDGVIEANEVTLADSASYAGSSLPTQEASVSTHLALWRGVVTVGGVLDYRGGYRIANGAVLQADNTGNTRQTNVATAPLWLQARAIENAAFNFNRLDVEDGSLVRVRELSITYAVPQGFARALRARSVSVTGAVRNLALWSRYTGVDPEASNTLANNIQSTPTNARYMVNSNVREDFGSVPLLRYWVLRLNVRL